jgi:hypothetical protein
LRSSPQAAFGALIGGLIGLGAAGEEGFELGAERGAEAVAERWKQGCCTTTGPTSTAAWSAGSTTSAS